MAQHESPTEYLARMASEYAAINAGAAPPEELKELWRRAAPLPKVDGEHWGDGDGDHD